MFIYSLNMLRYVIQTNKYFHMYIMYEINIRRSEVLL